MCPLLKIRETGKIFSNFKSLTFKTHHLNKIVHTSYALQSWRWTPTTFVPHNFTQKRNQPHLQLRNMESSIIKYYICEFGVLYTFLSKPKSTMKKSIGSMAPFILCLQTQERKRAKHEYKLE